MLAESFLNSVPMSLPRLLRTSVSFVLERLDLGMLDLPFSKFDRCDVFYVMMCFANVTKIYVSDTSS